MAEPVISVKGVSKKYRIGLTHKKSDTMLATILNGLKSPLTNLNRIRNLSKLNDDDDSIFWALKDVSFDVQEGEVLGIIGHNGAGKSTLLKLLSRIAEPSAGEIRIHGRVAALLEVGTGFHPELTGRENIYMNGTILGMRKWEIDQKMEEIVDFSGVEKHLDTPVKFYSSGMRVRLGFSVAAHLDPEILIIDEVLSVGDAEFQKKCLGKMGEVSKRDGRTVLFVSHNMASVKALCKKGVLLDKGKTKLIADVETIVKHYLGGETDNLNYKRTNALTDGFELIDIAVANTGESVNEPIIRDREICFAFNYDNREHIQGLYFNIKIKDEEGRYLITTTSDLIAPIINSGKGQARMKIPAGFFNEGQFFIDLMVIQKKTTQYKVYFHAQDILCLQISPERRELGTWMGNEKGFIRHTFDWNI